MLEALGRMMLALVATQPPPDGGLTYAGDDRAGPLSLTAFRSPPTSLQRRPGAWSPEDGSGVTSVLKHNQHTGTGGCSQHLTEGVSGADVRSARRVWNNFWCKPIQLNRVGHVHHDYRGEADRVWASLAPQDAGWWSTQRLRRAAMRVWGRPVRMRRSRATKAPGSTTVLRW